MPRSRRPFFEERRSQGEVVYGHLKKRPRTCGEIVALTGFKHQSASARLNDLEKAGCARRSGEKREGSDIYEIVASSTYEDFRKWQRGAGSREPSPRTKLLKLCESLVAQLHAGSSSRTKALEKIESAIFSTFD